MRYGQQVIVTAQILSDPSSSDRPGGGLHLRFAGPFPGAPDDAKFTHTGPRTPSAGNICQPTFTLRSGIAYIRVTPRRAGGSADSSSEIFNVHEGLSISIREDGRFIGGKFKVEKVFDTLDDNSLSRRSRNYVSPLSPEELQNLQSQHPSLRRFTMRTVAASDTVWPLCASRPILLSLS